VVHQRLHRKSRIRNDVVHHAPPPYPRRSDRRPACLPLLTSPMANRCRTRSRPSARHPRARWLGRRKDLRHGLRPRSHPRRAQGSSGDRVGIHVGRGVSGPLLRLPFLPAPSSSLSPHRHKSQWTRRRSPSLQDPVDRRSRDRRPHGDFCGPLALIVHFPDGINFDGWFEAERSEHSIRLPTLPPAEVTPTRPAREE
jgi:hypothetical protein